MKSLEKPKLPIRVSDILLKPLKIKFDITTLDMIISFIYKESTLRTRKTLTNIYKLVTHLDESVYNDNPYLQSRLWVIERSLYAKLIEGFETDEFIKQTCFDDVECDAFRKEVLDTILSTKKINYDESKALIKRLDDILEYGYTITVKDVMQQILNQIDDGDFKTYKAVSEDLYNIANTVINIKRNVKSLGSDQTFSLVEDQFDTVINDAVEKLKDRNRIFITGIQRWNTLLAPGYMSKRLYTYLAFPGKGKSTILLKSALDIKKYNKDIKPKDPLKRPAILFITMENDITETIERMYNMTVDGDDIRNYSAKQIKRKMREKGGLKLTDDDNIDIIIKEYKNREIDTNDLYSIINDLYDEGVEVITLILDYMKRIRPAERASDEKGELKNISNELKEIAKFFDIPCITAQQLNRSGAAVVDAALQSNKHDVTKLVGSENIGSAWEIQENSDWTCIINPEVKADTNELYLTFKLLKRRYRSAEENEHLKRLEYFNQPFEPGNSIKLLDDIELPKALALESLSSEFVSTDEKRGKQNATERKTRNSSAYTDVSDFEPFDMNQAMNY